MRWMPWFLFFQVEEKKKNKEEERKLKKHKHKKKKHTKYSSEGDSDSERSAGEKKDKHKRYRDESDHMDEKKHKKHSGEPHLDVGGDESEQDKSRKRNNRHREDEYYDRSKQLKHLSGDRSRSDAREEEGRKSSHYRESDTSRMSRHKSTTESDPYTERNSSKRKEDKTGKYCEDGSRGDHTADDQSAKNIGTLNSINSTHYNRPPRAPKLSAEEKAARAREMQLDAEVHEEERWKRLKKASEADAREAARNAVPGGRNFLDAAQKSIYGTEKGGSSSVEESVRRRAYYLQGRSSHDGNAFRR